MRTLFVKLFLWFWVAMTLSGGVFFFLAFNMRLRPVHEQMERRFAAEQRELISRALELYARSAVADYERQGTLPAEEASPAAPGRTATYLFTGTGAPLSRNAPPAVGEAVRQLLAGGEGMVRERENLTLALRVQTPRGKGYLAAASARLPPPPPPPPRRGHLPPNFWYQYAITFIISGCVCYGLAWRLSAPVRKLREAAQSLAAGDLTARVVIDGGRFEDEAAALGRDFNTMADRIEKLLTTQKQLVRDLSHELRSPLARLIVALGLARRGSSPQAGAALDRIEQEAERLNQMIGEMLTLAQLESGYREVEFQPVDLDGLVREILNDAAFEAASSGKGVVAPPCGILTVQGNRELLRRALENVIRNALRYTEEGTQVEVRLEREGGWGVVRVRDHGPGVPAHALGDIFRPFYRAEAARDRVSGGTGIGLAITAQTVHLHRGEVAARNLDEGGLEVELRLPERQG